MILCIFLLPSLFPCDQQAVDEDTLAFPLSFMLLFLLWDDFVTDISLLKISWSCPSSFRSSIPLRFLFLPLFSFPSS